MQALSPMLVSDFHSARISNSLESCPIHRGMQIHAKQLYTIMKTTKDCCSIIPVGISSKSVSRADAYALIFRGTFIYVSTVFTVVL